MPAPVQLRRRRNRRLHPVLPRAVKEANLAGLCNRPDFTLFAHDLRDADLAPTLDGVEAVFHLAAMPGLPRSWTDFALYESCNIAATQRLLEAARRTSTPAPIRLRLHVVGLRPLSALATKHCRRGLRRPMA